MNSKLTKSTIKFKLQNVIQTHHEHKRLKINGNNHAQSDKRTNCRCEIENSKFQDFSRKMKKQKMKKQRNE